MGRGARTVLAAVLLAGLAAAVGCALPAVKRPVPFTPPHAQALAPAETEGPCPFTAMYSIHGCMAPFDPAASDYPMRRPRHVLALSGGGAYGAYSAGFIDGWTQSGTRPEFDVVAGISTGALIAPLAFLGPEYDTRLGQLYTTIRAGDVFRVRSWVTIPCSESIASSAPLKKLIDTDITPEVLERIAAEHRKGRRLYVGTTNLDTRRLAVWDMGAIAARADGGRLFREVLLASASVPGMLPPVRFDIEVDGRPATELHSDGATAAQLFVPSHVFAAAAAAAANDPPPPPGTVPAPQGNLYVVVAGKVFPDAAPVRARVLPVLNVAANTILYSHCRADLANLYGLARASGMKYHLTALAQGFGGPDTSVDFDRAGMQLLFAEGVRQGASGPAWMYGPPTLSPGDGDYIRTGLRFRTPPEPPVAAAP